MIVHQDEMLTIFLKPLVNIFMLEMTIFPAEIEVILIHLFFLHLFDQFFGHKLLQHSEVKN